MKDIFTPLSRKIQPKKNGGRFAIILAIIFAAVLLFIIFIFLSERNKNKNIEIIFAGLGVSQTATQEAIEKLSPNITLGFWHKGNSLGRWIALARKNNQRVVLQFGEGQEYFIFSKNHSLDILQEIKLNGLDDSVELEKRTADIIITNQNIKLFELSKNNKKNNIVAIFYGDIAMLNDWIKEIKTRGFIISNE